MDELEFLFDEAVLLTLKEQELAGLDYVTDGEQRRRSFFEYITEAVDGYQNKVKRSYRFSGGESYENIPVVAGPLRIRDEEFPAAREVRFVKAHTTRLAKVPVASVSQLLIMYPRDSPVPGYTRSQYAEDCVRVVRSECQAAFKAGADLVQLDAPEFCFLTDPRLDPSEGRPRETEREWIALNNEAIRGLTGNLAVHVCFGNYKATHSADGSFQTLLPDLYDLKIGVYVLELAHARHEDDLMLFKEHPLPSHAWLAAGAIDVKTPDVEPPSLVKKRLLRAAGVVGPEHLQATADCGFAPTWDSDVIPRRACYLKLKALAEGSRLAKVELGFA